MSKSNIFQRNLYILLSYLSGWGEVRDFSSTTRRDMIESILEDLNDYNLLSDEIHEEGVKSVVERFNNRTGQDGIVSCLESMPRQPTEIVNEFDAVSWVDPDRIPNFEGASPEDLDAFYKKQMHEEQLGNPIEMFGMDLLTLSEFINWVRSEAKNRNESVNEVLFALMEGLTGKGNAHNNKV